MHNNRFAEKKKKRRVEKWRKERKKGRRSVVEIEIEHLFNTKYKNRFEFNYYEVARRFLLYIAEKWLRIEKAFN